MTPTEATDALAKVDNAMEQLRQARELVAGHAQWHLSADLRDQMRSLEVSRTRLWRLARPEGGR